MTLLRVAPALFILAAGGCFALRETEPAHVSADAARTADSLLAVTSRRLFERGDEMSREDLRAAVADLRLAYRLHPQPTGQALSNAATVFDRLAEPDSAIAVLWEGMGRSPVLGEELGLRLLLRREYAAARAAFAAALADLRAHPALGVDADPQIRDGYSAALVRLSWLAAGRPDGLAEAASLEPVVRNSVPVRFAVCLAEGVEPREYAQSAHGGALLGERGRGFEDAPETPGADVCLALLTQ